MLIKYYFVLLLNPCIGAIPLPRGALLLFKTESMPLQPISPPFLWLLPTRHRPLDSRFPNHGTIRLALSQGLPFTKFLLYFALNFSCNQPSTLILSTS